MIREPFRVLLALLALFLSGSLAAAQVASAPSALRQPIFVRQADDAWGAFPATSAQFSASSTGITMRSPSGGRALQLSLPPGLTIQPGRDSGAEFRRIHSTGTAALASADSMIFRSPAGSSFLEVSFADAGVLDLIWQLGDHADLASVSLRLHRMDSTHDVLSALNADATDGSLRWFARTDGSFGLEPKGGTDASGSSIAQPLIFSTLLGGAGFDQISDLQVATNGDLIAVGSTASPDFPVTPGALDRVPDVGVTNSDSFIAGISPDGSTLRFATFLGGSDLEGIRSLAIDADGTLVVAGVTFSADHPTTHGAFDTSWNGGSEDAFVARIAGDGSALLQSTYIGGSEVGADQLIGTAIDPVDGTILVIGRTCSEDWPMAPNAFQPTVLPPSQCNAVVARFDPGLTTLLNSTFLGSNFGTLFGGVLGVAANSEVVVSTTHSGGVTYPVTLAGRGAFPGATLEDTQNVLVRLSSDLSSLEWSTYVQAGLEPHPRPDGSIVLVGSTYNPNFPTTPGAFSQTFSGPLSDAELAACAISGDGTQLLWSTFITADGRTLGVSDSVVDDEGRVFFCGSLATTNYPFTPDAHDTTLTGLSETAITVLDATGSNVLYASLIGVGQGSETLNGSIALDNCGGAYVASETFTSAFPTTPGVIDESYNGGGDAWIVRINALSPWQKLGGELIGVKGRPKLTANGPICEGEPTTLTISRAPDFGSSFLVLGFSELSAPLKGGVLIPAPDFVKFLTLDGNGARTLAFDWPSGTPSGLEMWLQGWQPDGAAVLGFSATNAVLATVP